MSEEEDCDPEYEECEYRCSRISIVPEQYDHCVETCREKYCRGG